MLLGLLWLKPSREVPCTVKTTLYPELFAITDAGKPTFQSA